MCACKDTMHAVKVEAVRRNALPESPQATFVTNARLAFQALISDMSTLQHWQ